MGRFLSWWRARSKKAQIAMAVGTVLAIYILFPSSDSGGKKSAQDVDKHTRAYVTQMQACSRLVGLVVLEIRRGKSTEIQLADDTTKARDTCDAIRIRLLTMNTDHFDDQAIDAWFGVDRYKSGLNALLAYIDNPEPSKLIEARSKLQEGDATAARGIREINARRRIYHLKALKG